MRTNWTRRRSATLGPAALTVIAATLLAGCEDGSTGARGPAGPAGPAGPPAPTSTELAADEDAPGVNFAITGLAGATGAGGAFQVGDVLTVTFTVTKDDGSPWGIAELDRLRALVSGPTFNYQRVFAEANDLLAASVQNPDGSFTYTFGPIPATYLPPLNDTDSFDEDDGEMAGMPLLDGTYTVGLYGFWEYDVEGGEDGVRDVGDATFDFLLGDAAAVAPRAVTSMDNCNTCHARLEAHGGFRRNLTICLMCHTSGSEDRNVPDAAGGTPGASIDFRIMVHKIHNGAHLPSVLGVGTDEDGNRVYDLEPQPYQLVGFGNSVHDYSDVHFPVWPSLSFPTLRDDGYSDLSGDEQDLEDIIREGVVSCDTCHGDPDGEGPLEAPADGMLAYQQPTRNACGSCHDDVDWDLPYVANTDLMPPQENDSNCLVCHTATGADIATVGAHLHPLDDPELNPGLVFGISDIAADGAGDGDGTIDVGDKVAVTMTITDDEGNAVDPADIASMTVAISGPTSNLNLVLHQSFPTAALTGAQPYTVNLPEDNVLEFAGDATGALGDAFETQRTPHWADMGAATTVYRVTGKDDGLSTLVDAASAPQNYLDVVDASNFARNEYIVVDEGIPGAEEYLRIQFVDGNRLWFGSPTSSSYPSGLRFDHPAGAVVEQVVLDELEENVDYDLDVAGGTITELVEFGAGAAVLVTYTSDFVMPETYPTPLNGSPDLDETHGEWAGKPIVDGTYILAAWGYRSLSIELYGETNSYRAASLDDAVDFLVGDAVTEEPWALISSGENCLSCHAELRFHGGTRGGFGSCLVCHGTAGSEDRTQYVAANAPETPGVSIGFRQMLHKIHMGEELANASTYTVIGFGFGYPNNFSPHTYGEVVFPAFPEGVKDCATCHGEDNEAWIEPAPRGHPTEQMMPILRWRETCSSCHDSDDSIAHMEVQTSMGGLESCGVCHGEGKDEDVAVAHKVR